MMTSLPERLDRASGGRRPPPIRYPSALCLVLALAIGPLSTAHAERWRPPVDLTASPGEVTLWINHRPAFRFENLGAAWAPRGRPYWVAARLRKLIGKGLTAAGVTISSTPQGTVILAGAEPLLTVTDSEARAKAMTRAALASTWAKTLRDLLALPPLTATPDRIVLPPGGSKVVEVGGAIDGPMRFALDPRGVVAVAPGAASRKLILTASKVGTGVLKVSIKGQSLDVPFAVRKYAGSVKNASVAVTGDGPDRSAFRRILDDAVERSIDLEPGAVARVDDTGVRIPTSVPPQGALVSFPVRLEGPAYLPVQTRADIWVTREEVGRSEPNLLFYSNRPEMLRRYGPLYTGVIRRNQAVRLLYHHQSAMDAPIRFMMQIHNGDAPARLQIIDGSATPQVDTYQIGDRAAARFFPAWLSDSGYIQSLDPGETITLLDQRLARDQTTSGIYHFVLLSGSDVTVQLRADAPDDPADFRPARSNPEVYPVTRLKFDPTYTVGGRWSFIPFGGDPVRTKDSSHPLHGNYGVVYDVDLQLSNPTEQKNTADVIFDPAAGIARGVFVVDGKMLEMTPLQPPQEFVIGSYPLAPGEKREVRILSMPLAGSNYPARITVRPRYTVAKQP